MRPDCRVQYQPDIPRLSLGRLVNSHGWRNLPPYHYSEAERCLKRVDLLGGKRVLFEMREEAKKAVAVCHAPNPVGGLARRGFQVKIDYMCQNEVSLEEFERLARGLNPRVYRFVRSGGGRFLRGTSLFEDVAKTLLTTNASWSFTKLMCHNLVGGASGRPYGIDAWSPFPTAEDITGMGVQFLREKCRLGYRAQYLVNVADAFIGNGNYEGWKSEETVRDLGRIKGLGHYSINHIRVLLGIYDRIPLDSEAVSYLAQYGLPSDEKGVHAHYARWHPYEFLAYKIERYLNKSNWNGE